MGFKQKTYNVDFCVIGGGMAGICAALAAARHGAKVLLMHDRPVFGGNSSSECRVHICGADVHNANKNMRETGILEELRMENLYRNPNRNFSIWDTVLYEKVLAEKNIISLPNCSCLKAEMDVHTISNVTGWQLTTQTYHKVNANIFADCSGDGVLAPLTNADSRIGREARSEFNEPIAPLESDKKTMGMTCLFQAKKYDTEQIFKPYDWAYQYGSCEDLPYGARAHRWLQMGYWWAELGGEQDSIHDTEAIKDELLKTTYGIWDHIKNHCENKDTAKNWALDWIQFLPAKRESRRYIGEHVLTQNDIEAEGKFDDLVAYGGWSMDDHHPAGFNAVKIKAKATIFHPAPSPYGIPYRSLYSRNIDNLMFAGRDASCTHAAMSSTRVMGTGCSMGQAVGTAAALAVTKGILPAKIKEHMQELQQTLINDDAYLPGFKQGYSKTIINAAISASQGDPELVRNGVNRPIGDVDNCWSCQPSNWLEYRFQETTEVNTITLILDSGLDQNVAMSYHQKDDQLTSPPGVMPKAFRIEGLIDDQWQELAYVEQNYQRFYQLKLTSNLNGIRFILDKTWGSETSCIYAFYVN